MENKLFVFSAPSGTGKTTIVKYLLAQMSNVVFSISATTRKARQGEVEGRDYFFISEEEFIKKIKENSFLEWEKFYDYYYGTLKSFVDENISKGFNVFLEVDVKGAIEIKRKCPEAVTIFFAPPSLEELEKRLRKRNTDSPEDLIKRIERASLEMSYQDKFDFCIINDDLILAKNQAFEIVNNNMK
jgi:guanylate kinase